MSKQKEKKETRLLWVMNVGVELILLIFSIAVTIYVVIHGLSEMVASEATLASMITTFIIFFVMLATVFVSGFGSEGMSRTRSVMSAQKSTMIYAVVNLVVQAGTFFSGTPLFTGLNLFILRVAVVFSALVLIAWNTYKAFRNR